MSSFNINGPSNKPIIQGSQNLGKDGGGGGNTGYMNMRNKKKEKKQPDEDDSIVLEEEQDSFSKSSSAQKELKENVFVKAISNFLFGTKKEKDVFEHSSNKEGQNNSGDDDYYSGIDV